MGRYIDGRSCQLADFALNFYAHTSRGQVQRISVELYEENFQKCPEPEPEFLNF
jgi:hypothetical protein